MNKFFSKSMAVAAFTVAAFVTGQAHASAVIGGTSLLSTANVDQLATWLGQGSIDLTNIFTKQAGNTSFDFHAAADGKGATFVVMQVTDTNTGLTGLVGGYDPLSWSSDGGWYLVDPLATTGFLFNLTSGVFSAERTDWQGQYQTYNSSNYGPTFGGGHDLYVDDSLTFSYMYAWSYATQNGSNLLGQSSYSFDLAVSSLEVFTISPGNTVPEPTSIALVGLALCGMFAARRRKKA